MDSKKKVISFKDLTEKKSISVDEYGDYLMGLTTTGDLAIVTREEDLCMTLLALKLHENGACTLSSANNDFGCFINNSCDPLPSEMHLVDGTLLEIADKRLEFVDGPIASQRRRKLPPTPGNAVGEAPPKPVRGQSTKNVKPSNLEAGTEVEKTGDEDKPNMDAGETNWVENSWCFMELPDSEQNMFKDMQTPEQISILTASYFSKQLRMFTDASITAKLLDDIFRLFMDTFEYAKETFTNYLLDMSKALSKVPNKTNTRPIHGPAVQLLTDLLKLCCEPVERVILLLDLLRTFSHFENNIIVMVNSQTTAAVLGSMSSFRDVTEVQLYGMDILSKIAKFQPTLDKKTPLREVGLDMILLGVDRHNKDLSLCRSACRVLANMAATLNTVLSNWIDTEDPTNEVVTSCIDKYEQLLEYVFEKGIPVVQGIMKNFGSDLGVNTEGRKFIFFYSKLTQLQQKRTARLKNANRKRNKEETDGNGHAVDIDEDEDYNNCNQHQQKFLLEENVVEDEPKSILKRIGSFENLRKSEKRLVFADDTEGESYIESVSSDSENDRFASEGCPEAEAVEKDDVFSRHVVQHFVKKSIRRRSQSAGTSEVQDDESEGEHEFLQSLSNKVIHQAQEEDFVIVKCDNQDEVHNSEMDRTNSDTLCNANEEVFKEQTTTESSVLENNDSATVETKKQFSDCNQTCGKSDLEELEKSISEDMKESVIRDVTFLGKLVRTQIIVYVGSLVFQGEDSTVLMVIDKPIQVLLGESGSPPELIVFAQSQYGDAMTLMDLEPAIVISVIDAVRYRSVTQDLVQSAVLSLTKSITDFLLPATVSLVMQFFKILFSDKHLHSILTDEKFLNDFRTCFQASTQKIKGSHAVEEILQKLPSQNVIV